MNGLAAHLGPREPPAPEEGRQREHQGGGPLLPGAKGHACGSIILGFLSVAQSNSPPMVERVSYLYFSQMLRRPLLYLWVFPTSCLGLIALVLGSVRGRVHTQIVDGVLELHGDWIRFFLSQCTLLPGGASAMTLGHVVLGCDPLLLDMKIGRASCRERV